MLLLKELAYIYRIRVLTNKDLNWTSSVYVILLWEFASAVTPSVVGGTAVAVFILLKEKINLGKSVAYVTLTAILDNLFFVITSPIVVLLIGLDIFPGAAGTVRGIFISSYSLIALYTSIMALGLFWKPRLFKWIPDQDHLCRVFKKMAFIPLTSMATRSCGPLRLLKERKNGTGYRSS